MSLAAHALCSEEWQLGQLLPPHAAEPGQLCGKEEFLQLQHTGPRQWLPPRGVVLSLGEQMYLTVQGCLQLRSTPAAGRSFPLLAGATCVCPGDNKCWCSLLLRDCMATCAGSQILIHLCLVSIYCNISRRP